MTSTNTFTRVPSLLSKAPLRNSVIQNWFKLGFGHRHVATISIRNVEAANLESFESIPGPRSWPVLGNLDYLTQHQTMHTLHLDVYSKTFGRFYRDNIVGRKALYISDPEIAEKVYRTEEQWPFRDFGDVMDAFFNERQRIELPKGLPEMQGEDWGHLRRILGKHMLQPMKIKNYFGGFNEVASDAMDVLRNQTMLDPVIAEFHESMISKWSMESIGTFAFGQRVGLLDNPPSTEGYKTYEAIKELFQLSFLLSRPSWGKYIYPSKFRRLQQITKEIQETGMFFVNNVVEHIKECSEKGQEMNRNIEKSLTTYLIKNDKLSPEECATHAIDSYSAGLDTTSATVFWLMYILGQSAAKQEILYQEIKQQVQDSDFVTDTMVQKMPYLRACFKESARLNPLATMIPRLFAEDVALNGYRIPAKTMIFLNSYVMGRDKAIFKDADTFTPERWLRDNENYKTIDLFASQPFGYGVRSCVGRRIAEAEMYVFITHLVKNFRFEYVGIPQNGVQQPVLMPSSPTSFAFYQR